MSVARTATVAAKAASEGPSCAIVRPSITPTMSAVANHAAAMMLAVCRTPTAPPARRNHRDADAYLSSRGSMGPALIRSPYQWLDASTVSRVMRLRNTQYVHAW
jgi:hypothetical protein